MNYNLLVSRVALLTLQLLQQFRSLLVTTTMYTKKSQDETILELTCGRVDAGI